MFALYERTRRRTRRFPVHLPVQLVTEGSVMTAITGDLSLDGANLLLDEPVSLGSCCRIRLGPRGRLARLCFFCKVVRRTGSRVALQFVGRTREQLRALDAYLASLTPPQSA